MADLSATVLELAAAVAAAWGAWRCLRLQRLAKDRRVGALAWFFGLFALSMVFAAAWSYQVATHVPSPETARTLRAFRPQGAERVTGFLVLQHLAMLAALAVAVVAFGRRPRANPALAAVPLLAIPVGNLGTLVPLVLATEAALSLYLAVRAILNHVERKTPGALQVAFGFALFFLGHLLVFLRHTPGASRTPIGDIVVVVGIVLLAQMVPGRR